ncbi:hypothetical protein TW1_054 [Pseudoalteromonas phage TW1]|uniref:hypothetical protein n=1 Tax=Pseudoalteromonas phage TW1 TaxID=1366055 RepID=UPI00035AB400|nr:hypothetical protein PP585_gp54 [Pseudoalteromonas phage TW1]AGR46570.1 hypothetical protein TW1_054 [Pseudoalteromonas phage TW1]
MITEIKVGDYIEKSELDTEQKYNDVVEVFKQWGFKWGEDAVKGYGKFKSNHGFGDSLGIAEDGFYHLAELSSSKERKLTYDQVMQLKKVDVDNCNVDKLVSNRVSTVNRDLEGQMAGKKFDGGKLRFSLIPPQPLSDVNKVLEFGAKKYGANNWQKVDNAKERYFNAAMRHLLAWQSGELLDDESGLPHLAHAQCCLMFMMHFDVD